MAALLQWFRTVFVDQFDAWAALGFAAQFLFMMRFGVQWIASEHAGRSVMPVTFWFFSVAGGVLLLVYAIKRQDRCSSPDRRSASSSTAGTSG